MINRKELAICRRRGHEHGALLGKDWRRCRWCGIWLREVTTIEERRDEPPKDEQSPFQDLDQRLGNLAKKKEGKTK